ncbi:MAG: hypothetical protein HYV07_26285 [Deltaproteobacteria bacterium]|nr:hypothetical protein [Deltaproteobacteria bacterium]
MTVRGEQAEPKVRRERKWAHWPSPEAAANGFGFVDLCVDLFSTHYVEQEDGDWLPLTKAAQYTRDVLRLDSKHLREVRVLLRQLADAAGVSRPNWDRPREQIEMLNSMPKVSSVSG